MKPTPEQLRQTAAAMIALADGKPIESFDTEYNDAKWVACESPYWYLPRYIYRPKPEPKTRPWSKPEDVPLNCWARNGHGGHQLVTYIALNGITYGGTFFKWEEIVAIEYSTDRIHWHPCTVTE